MAKNDNKKEAAQGLKESNTRLGGYQEKMEEKRQAYETQSNAERELIKGSLTPNLGTSGGLDPTVVTNIRNLYGGKTVGQEAAGGSSGGGGGGDSGGGGGGGAPAAPAPGVFDESETAFRNINTESQAGVQRMRDQIGALQEMAKTGAIDPAAAASVQAIADKLKNFQFDPAAAAEIKQSIANLARFGETGGIDPERLALLRESADFMMKGGISEPDLARWRGTGYDEFAKTGGWSDTERADYRDRATSVIPSMYQQQMADAARMRNVGGGNADSFLAGASRLNRQSSQDMVAAARDAEIDLGHEVREGRKWGIKGISDTEKDIQAQYGLNRASGLSSGITLENDLAQNRINATQMSGQLNVDFNNAVNEAFIKAQSGAGTLESNMATAIAANKVKAQEAAATAEGLAQRLRTEAQQASAQGLLAVAAQKQAAADRAAATGAAARAADQANERWWANFQMEGEQFIGKSQMQGQQFSQGAMIDLYGMDPTLNRDQFGLDIENSRARNAGMLGDIGGDGVDWAKWGSLGLAGMQTYNDANRPNQNYQYDSDDPRSPWYDRDTR